MSEYKTTRPKMPVNTLTKDRSKHFSGRAARLASCLPVYSERKKKPGVKLPFEANK